MTSTNQAYIIPVDAENRFREYVNEAIQINLREAWQKLERVLTLFPAEGITADDATVTRVALAIAPQMGHELFVDMDEDTGEDVEGCDSCAGPGWPCDTAIAAGRAAIEALQGGAR